MNVLIHLLMALEAVVCLMLIGIILIQRSKGQGLGLSFGGGAAESVFGGQMGNVLTRTTVILAIAFLVNTTLLAILKPRGASADVVEAYQEAPAASEQTAAAAPAAPAATQEELEAALADELDAAPAPAADAASAAEPVATPAPVAEPAPAAAPAPAE